MQKQRYQLNCLKKFPRETLLSLELCHRHSFKWNIKDAINLFHQMQAANFEARAEIMTSIPDAYMHLAAVQLGKAIIATV